MKPIKVIYRGDATESQVNYGSNDDPRGILVPGQAYEIDGIEVHSFYTQIRVKEYPEKQFNSVHFDDVVDHE